MSMAKMLKFKDFTPTQPVIIRTLSNGYTVEVGCKSFVVGDIEDLVQELYAYLKGESSDFNKGYKVELKELPSEEVCGTAMSPGPPSPAPGLGATG